MKLAPVPFTVKWDDEKINKAMMLISINSQRNALGTAYDDYAPLDLDIEGTESENYAVAVFCSAMFEAVIVSVRSSTYLIFKNDTGFWELAEQAVILDESDPERPMIGEEPSVLSFAIAYMASLLI